MRGNWMNLGRPADRGDLDRLLDGARTGTPSADEPLARLLADAAGPPRPGDLAGEQAALAAFRAARSAPAPRPRRHRSGLRPLAWLAGFAAAATAGVAFAAVAVDGGGDPPPPPPVGTTAAPPPSGPATGRPTEPTPTETSASTDRPGSPTAATTPARPTDEPDAGTSEAPPSPSAAAGANLHGHCNAYLSKKPQQREKALTSPGFAGLVAAAGGADRVEEYCRALDP
ncbi:hypothetical protein [Micromonospora sp. SH-82]|uniref:hypothetical protein n=1 Tax=Micromonospora sp. SH-82 TaxID=3132938 RepID=UPI003EBED4ED